jgi:hypothetical protein
MIALWNHLKVVGVAQSVMIVPNFESRVCFVDRNCTLGGNYYP